MAERYPVGTRVVLVEDHRYSERYGCEGWVGTIVEPFSEANERGFMDGGYSILFEDNNRIWCVNASAVAVLDRGHSDADLAMAVFLAQELRGCVENFDVDRGELVSDWLRDQIFNEIKARVR